MPGTIGDTCQIQSLEHFISLKGQVEVLFVGEDEKWQLGKLLFFHELFKLLDAFVDSFLVGRVNDKDDAVGAVVVVLPVGSDCLLTTDVPHVQLEAVLGLQRD